MPQDTQAARRQSPPRSSDSEGAAEPSDSDAVADSSDASDPTEPDEAEESVDAQDAQDADEVGESEDSESAGSRGSGALARARTETRQRSRAAVSPVIQQSQEMSQETREDVAESKAELMQLKNKVAGMSVADVRESAADAPQADKALRRGFERGEQAVFGNVEAGEQAAFGDIEQGEQAALRNLEAQQNVRHQQHAAGETRKQQLFEQHGRFNNGSGSFGESVEEPLLDEAIDYAAAGDMDGDMFDAINDPVNRVEMMAVIGVENLEATAAVTSPIENETAMPTRIEDEVAVGDAERETAMPTRIEDEVGAPPNGY